MDHHELSHVTGGDDPDQLIAMDDRQGVTVAFLQASKDCFGHLGNLLRNSPS
jgi:hypothetical protein